MAVKMRLRREGKKKQPFYRVVVADVRAPRDGGFIDDLGYYQPLHDPSTISIDRERALKWLHDGAQPTDAVVNLLRIEGIWEEFRPGDPGRDRSAKHAARAAKVAEREAQAREEAGAARKQREDAEAAAAARSAAEQAPADAVADDEAVKQAIEGRTQPDAAPAEETGAAPPEQAAEETGAAPPEQAAEETGAAPAEQGVETDAEPGEVAEPGEATEGEATEEEQS